MSKIITTDAIQRHYQRDDVVSAYVAKRFREPMGTLKHRIQVGIINRVLGGIDYPIVLDLACGPGRVSKDLQGVEHGVAADASPAMLREARKVLGKQWTLQEIDAFRLPFRKEQFEVVTSFRFIRHFNIEKRQQLYAQVRRVLKPKGYFILDFLDKRTTRWLKIVGKHKYAVYDELYIPKQFRKELADAGFEVVSVIPVVKHVFLQGVISKVSHFFYFWRFGWWSVRVLEKIPGTPWEWVAVCKKR
ncbi:TPA: methyltransferase domain-containing protein [Candidatus Woesearchaeota archaeon]|nr:methyltransferase domain-containing protein [Candidatus Woesearchaeota archaeon]